MSNSNRIQISQDSKEAIAEITTTDSKEACSISEGQQLVNTHKKLKSLIHSDEMVFRASVQNMEDDINRMQRETEGLYRLLSMGIDKKDIKEINTLIQYMSYREAFCRVIGVYPNLFSIHSKIAENEIEVSGLKHELEIAKKLLNSL